MSFPQTYRAEPYVAGLVCALVFWAAHFYGLAGPYVVNEDVRQQIYWMEQWQNPELFHNHYLTRYSRLYVPPGVKAVYRIFSPVVDPLYFSKVLPGLLFALLGVCLFLIGREYGDRGLAWSCVAAFWLMPFFIYHLSGGLARAFAAPLLALFWLAWLKRNDRLISLSILLMALFIPYIFVLAGFSLGLAFAAGRAGPLLGLRIWRPPYLGRINHWLILLAGAALVFYLNHRLIAAGFGPWAAGAEALEMPELGAGGRLRLFPIRPFMWEVSVGAWGWIGPFHELGFRPGLAVSLGVLGLASFGLFCEFRKWRTSSFPARTTAGFAPVVFLVLASGILYLLARILALRLFVPNRFVIYPFHLFFCLFLAWGIYAALRPGLNSGRVFALVLAAAALAGAWRLHGVGLSDYGELRPAYEAVLALPQEARLAGHPRTMDNVQTFGRRPVLINYEQAHPWSAGLWQKEKPLLEDLFRAYYSPDPEEAALFCRKYGVTHLVVEERCFNPQFMTGKPFFAPFDRLIRELVRPGRDYALLRGGNGGRQEIMPGIWLVEAGSIGR